MVYFTDAAAFSVPVFARVKENGRNLCTHDALANACQMI